MSVQPNLSVPERGAPERILNRLEWHVIRRLDGLLQGDYRTLFYGEGVDFADLREYEATDDIRQIDWNVTARMNSPFVRQYAEDRELTAWFLLDVSPSMTFGPQDRSKKEVLIDVVTTLARLLTRSGNRVGAVLYNNQIQKIFPPRGGRNQVLHLTRDLLLEPNSSMGSTTDLSVLLGAALNTIKRRSLVFLMSDFISQPGWVGQLALLNKRHELVAVRLLDPREVELPDAGLIVVEDAETSEQIYVDTSDPGFRRRFLEAAESRENRLKQGLSKSGVDLYTISTEEDLVGAFIRMATLRKKRRWR